MAPGDTNVCTTPICPSKTGEILQLLEGVKNTERTPCIFGVNEMNTKVNDENVKALLERAKSSMAVSGNFGALVFTAAVVFVSLSHQTCVSYILSSILIFTTFLFVLNIGIWENVIASWVILNKRG